MEFFMFNIPYFKDTISYFKDIPYLNETVERTINFASPAISKGFKFINEWAGPSIQKAGEYIGPLKGHPLVQNAFEYLSPETFENLSPMGNLAISTVALTGALYSLHAARKTKGLFAKIIPSSVFVLSLGLFYLNNANRINYLFSPQNPTNNTTPPLITDEPNQTAGANQI
jgi:hypothetical protein